MPPSLIDDEGFVDDALGGEAPVNGALVDGALLDEGLGGEGLVVGASVDEEV